MELIFATHNEHKAFEIRKEPDNNHKILTLNDIGYNIEIEETGSTLEENSYIKAKHIYDITGKSCFADDTGLEIEALNGEPGVYSARYAGEEGDSRKNIEKVLEKLKDKTNRKARFRTVITLIMEGKTITFEGIVEGEIIREPRGKDGFGYDPVFVPQGYNKTFAELTPEEKNKISHRGMAVRKLIRYLNQYPKQDM